VWVVVLRLTGMGLAVTGVTRASLWRRAGREAGQE